MNRIDRVWLPGDSSSQDLSVSLPRDRDVHHCWPWELLSIASPEGLTAQLFAAVIELVDYQGTIGPIHLPCLIHLPGSTRVTVTPDSAVSVKTTIVATVTRADSREARNWAMFSRVCAPGDVFSLPQWVRGVGSQDAASFVFLDRAGVPITAAISGATDRPHLAASVQCVAGGVITEYY